MLRPDVCVIRVEADEHLPGLIRGTTRVDAARGTDRDGRINPSPALKEGAPVCVIEVADEDPGLSADKAAHVFERFYRADPSRSRDHGGSGLGLAIAAAIAANHRGRLELDTGPGKGCTFRLVLPHTPQDT
ncbi:ATP-binding protein [Actinomadura fibrosa]|uniref:histidine kinase n=1 Tax=Actinomadura fibrosa TaxID=111802 RepID=A0ABW2Y503_9ACTN|nr:ATP-binding protein [Actinomadura fibrosa]